jgi:hypothetical protein
VLSINYFPTLILELMRQNLNYLRFKILMDYHLEITKKGNSRFLFFIIIFKGRGNNILTFVFVFFFFFFVFFFVFFFFFLCVKIF